MKQKSRVFSVFLALTPAALVPIEDIYTGGRVEIVYLDGRPNVVLIPSAQRLKWGP
jgi:hypothetical protein